MPITGKEYRPITGRVLVKRYGSMKPVTDMRFGAMGVGYLG